MKRSVFATNVDELLEERRDRFRWWEGELQVPRTTLHRWASVGLARPDSRSEPYLNRLVDYFGLPDYDCLWHDGAVSKIDKLRIRLAATKQQSRIVRKKESPQQATRVIQDAGLWDAFERRVGATDQTEAELTLTDMVMNGNWDSTSIMDHMESRGIAEVNLECKVERTQKPLEEKELWDAFKRMYGLGSDEQGEQKLREMLGGFWMPQGVVAACEKWYVREQIEQADQWSTFKLWVGTQNDDKAALEIETSLAEGWNAQSILAELEKIMWQ